MVAELSAAFGSASLGIAPTVRHADYIGAWLEVLREDHGAIVRAASRASKAADYLLGFAPSSNAGGDEVPIEAWYGLWVTGWLNLRKF